MAELEKQQVYACSLSMPSPDNPILSEWIEEISRHVERNKSDEMYLIGHSLGVPAILRFHEKTNAANVKGIILVSGPLYKTADTQIDAFLDEPFDFPLILTKIKRSVVIHGDNDETVPMKQGELLAKEGYP